jgi:hypothetical protein
MADIGIAGIERVTTKDSPTVTLEFIKVDKTEKATVSDSPTLGFNPGLSLHTDKATVRDRVSVWIYYAPLPNWPSIAAPTFGSTEEDYRPQIRTEFDGNYVQSRVRATRSVKRWVWRWNYMTEADYQTLITFFQTNQGGSFNFTHPVTSVAYACRFSGNSLSSTFVTRGETYYRSVEVGIEEV